MEARYFDEWDAAQNNYEPVFIDEVRTRRGILRVGDKVEFNTDNKCSMKERGRNGTIVRFVVDDLRNPVCVDVKMDDTKRIKTFETIDMVKVGG